MPQIRCHNITLGHSATPLIENASLTIERGEKVCIIGRNGVGKSTFLKALIGEVSVDQGVIEKEPTLRFAHLEQTFPSQLNATVYEIAQQGLVDSQVEDWEKQHRSDKVLSHLELDGYANFDTLSGGLKRRVLLAKALISEPDVLLLDEPTNHLDIEAIQWLEKFLVSYRATVIFITHDRVLMEKVSTHIVEVDNGKLLSWHGRYPEFLRHKEHMLAVEEKENALFDKRLAQEEVWIRQGIKARRTRNEGRVRALEKMRETRSNRRVRQGNVNLQQNDVKTSGKIVFEANEVNFVHDPTRPLVKDFSTIIVRGDKIGIIGANGMGKSTLLNLLLENLTPSSGSITRGTQLEIGYFDQEHTDLDDSKTVQDNVGEGSDQVTINGKSKHIMGYLQDFLFAPERARSPVKYLSGGERNRVMLAKLFLKPCNLLVMDEPTNDLDVETLELLEEQLANYSGTLLLVSHDRAFLNNVVTSTLVMEGEGHVGEYIGGYDDWIRQRKNHAPTRSEKTKSATPTTEPKKAKQKLSYNDQRELSKLPGVIDKLEAKQAALHETMADPKFYRAQPEDVTATQKELTDIEQKIKDAYARWETLDQS